MNNFSSLECSVCTEPFNLQERLPRILNCNVHTLCTNCIQDWLDLHGNFKCPLDSIEFEKPNLTIEDFPVNDDFVVALKILQTDGLEICDETPDNQKCLKHNLKLESVCLDCKEPICSHCETDEHERHFYIDQEDTEALLKKAENTQFGYLEKYKQLKKEEEKIIEERKNDMKAYITAGFDEIADFLTKKKDEALRSVDGFVQGKVKTCSQIDKAIKDELEKLEKSMKKIEDMEEDLDYEGLIARYKQADDEERDRWNAFCEMILGMKNLENKKLEGVMEKKRQENLKIRQTIASVTCNFNEMVMEMLQQVEFVEFKDPSLIVKKETPRETRKPEHEETLKKTRHPEKCREDRQGQERSEEEILFSRLSQYDEDSDSDNEKIIKDLSRFFQHKWGILWRAVDEGNVVIDASSSFVGDQEISEIVSLFKSLKTNGQVRRIIAEKVVGIEGCFHIQTDEGLEKLGKILSYLKYLREVQVILKECLNVSEEEFFELGVVFSRLRKLRKLNIELHRCEPLDLAKTIDEICSISKLDKFVLSFSKCHKVTEEHLRDMLEDISEINSGVKFDLEIMKCKRISKSSESVLKRTNGDVHKIRIEEYRAGETSRTEK